MTTQKDARTLSDGLNNGIDDLRTLLSVMYDQLSLYLSNRKLLGAHPNGELLRCCASEVSSLLALSQSVLARMDENAEALSDVLYHSAEADDGTACP